VNTVSGVLISVLIVVAIVLFNFLAPRLARWQQEQERMRREALVRDDVTPGAAAQPIVAAYQPLPGAADSGVQPRAVAGLAAPRRGSTVRWYLADRSKLRQAIIVATVLGPCRAHEGLHDVSRRAEEARPAHSSGDHDDGQSKWR
jgi:hypothetical protein